MYINIRGVKLLLILAVLATACNSRSRRIESELDEQTNVLTEEDLNSARYTINYKGTYRGILPCTDCEAISTEITIGDSTYTMKRVYMGEFNSDTIVDSGQYIWNGSGRSIIISMLDMPSEYIVGENMLTPVFMNPIDTTFVPADTYILFREK